MTVRRLAKAVAVAACAVLLLTSCIPATFVWGYVGEGSDFRLAFCGSSTVTMARLTVSEYPESGPSFEVQSVVWSGPRILLPEGAIFGLTSLPDGWQTTEDLDLSGSWDRIDVELYDRDKPVDYAYFFRADGAQNQWALSPRPGIFAGITRCRSPFDKDFVEQPSMLDSSTDDLVAIAASLAVPADEFWALLSATQADSHGYSSGLSAALARLAPEQVTAFHAQLMLQYFALDTALVWNASESQRLEDYDYESTLDSGDYFVEFRSLIIRGGEASVRAALGGETFPTQRPVVEWPGLTGAAGNALLSMNRVDIRTLVRLAPGMGLNSDGW